MVLKDLITRLENADQSIVVPKGFSNPHSYRGYYDELAFSPTENISVAEMLAAAEEALDNTYHGWKGGAFLMHEYTTVNIAYPGNTGEEIGHLLLDYILQEI